MFRTSHTLHRERASKAVKHNQNEASNQFHSACCNLVKLFWWMFLIHSLGPPHAASSSCLMLTYNWRQKVKNKVTFQVKKNINWVMETVTPFPGIKVRSICTIIKVQQEGCIHILKRGCVPPIQRKPNTITWNTKMKRIAEIPRGWKIDKD